MMDSPHDATVKASGRIDAPLTLRDGTLAWGPLLLLDGEDALRFEVSQDVQGRPLADVEAMVERIGLAVESAIIAASGTAARDRGGVFLPIQSHDATGLNVPC